MSDRFILFSCLLILQVGCQKGDLPMVQSMVEHATSINPDGSCFTDCGYAPCEFPCNGDPNPLGCTEDNGLWHIHTVLVDPPNAYGVGDRVRFRLKAGPLRWGHYNQQNIRVCMSRALGQVYVTAAHPYSGVTVSAHGLEIHIATPYATPPPEPDETIEFEATVLATGPVSVLSSFGLPGRGGPEWGETTLEHVLTVPVQQ